MFAIKVPTFNMTKVYRSRQALDWKYLSPGFFLVPHDNSPTSIRQYENARLAVSCNDEQFYQTWFKQFSLDIDYDKLINDCYSSSPTLGHIVNQSRGVHLIHIDIMPALFGFMLMDRIGYRKTQNALRAINSYIGNKLSKQLHNIGHVSFYDFPEVSSILEDQDKLSQCKLYGYEDDVIELCELINEGWLDIDELLGLETYEEASSYLNDFSECFSQFTIDKICLHSLGFSEVFPSDEKIERLLEKLFDCDSEIFVEWFLDNEELRSKAGHINVLIDYVSSKY